MLILTVGSVSAWWLNLHLPDDGLADGSLETGTARRSFTLTYNYNITDYIIIMADSTTGLDTGGINFVYITQYNDIVVFYNAQMDSITKPLPFSIEPISLTVVANVVLVVSADYVVWRATLNNNDLSNFTMINLNIDVRQVVAGNSVAQTHVLDTENRVWRLVPDTGLLNLRFDQTPIRKIMATTTGVIAVAYNNLIVTIVGPIVTQSSTNFTGDIIGAWAITNQGIVIQTTTGIYGTGTNNNGWLGTGSTGGASTWIRLAFADDEQLVAAAPLSFNQSVTHGVIYVMQSGRVFVAGSNTGIFWGVPGAGTHTFVETDVFDGFNIIQMYWSRRHIIIKSQYGRVALFEMTTGSSGTLRESTLSEDNHSTRTILHWAIIPQYLPNRPGYIFMGWYYDNGLTKPFITTSMPGHNLTLYARWERP